jgi:hypothetical protein
MSKILISESFWKTSKIHFRCTRVWEPSIRTKAILRDDKKIPMRSNDRVQQEKTILVEDKISAIG